MLAYLLLGVAQSIGLLMIPFGWPGVWLQIGALALFAWATGFQILGTVPLVLLLTVALLADLVEAMLAGGRMAPEVRRRAGVAGLVGGGAGATLGYAFPLVGSMFGALAGALLGALLAAFGPRPGKTSYASLGVQLIAMAVRTAAGVAVAVFTLLTLLR